MQQIERYGVIALVFLLVTIVAVSFWGDSKSPGFWSRLTGKGAKKDAVAAQTTPSPETVAQATQPTEPAPTTSERALAPELPLSPTSTPAPAPTSPPTTPPTTMGPPAMATYQATPPPASAPNPTPAPVVQAMSKPVVAPSPRAPAPVERTMTVASVPVSSSYPAASASYTVQKGDSLMRIAAKTLGSKERWTEIRDVNRGVDPHGLHVGQKLVIPASAKAGADAKHVVPAKKPATAPAAEKPASSSTGTYLVHKGDTLKSIAERHLGSRERWKEIAAANPKIDPNHLAVGMSLKLPHAKSSAPHMDAKEEPALAAATPREISSGHPHVR
jgi:nucleoid-associated protein YgaU